MGASRSASPLTTVLWIWWLGQKAHVRSPGHKFGGNNKGMPRGCTAIISVSQKSSSLREGRFLFIPGASRRRPMGWVDPRHAGPKLSPIPKFSLPSLVTSCPFLLSAQACSPTPATTQVDSKDCVPWRRHFRVESCLAQNPDTFPGGVSGFPLNWIQRIWADSWLSKRPSIPLVTVACVHTALRHGGPYQAGKWSPPWVS